MQFLDPVNRLPNMEDISSYVMKQNSSLFSALSKYMEINTYKLVDTPILEKSDLFLRRSGGNISSRLYQFNDPGGYDVCLRPEFTSAITRYVLSNPENFESPTRIYYFGPVFRYSKPGEEFSELPRQFNQFGAEIIGSDDYRYDAEIISLAYKTLQKVSNQNLKLIIGDIKIIGSISEHFKLSNRSKMFILENVQNIKNLGSEIVLDRAKELSFFEKYQDKDIEFNQNEKLIQSLRSEDLAQNSSRSTDEIIQRLSYKNTQYDDEKIFLNVLNIIYEIINIKGESIAVIDQIKDLFSKYKLDPKPVESFENILSFTNQLGVEKKFIEIDFGLIKDVSYYSGIIFNIYSGENELILGGGGRYDGLSRDLGYKNISSLGFAFDFSKILSIYNQNYTDIEPTIIRSEDKNDFSHAINYSQKLKTEGIPCIIDYEDKIDSKTGEYIFITVDGNIKNGKN